MSTSEAGSLLVVALGGVIALLVGFLRYRDTQVQQARNNESDEKLEETHAEAERDAAKASDAELDARLRDVFREPPAGS